MHATQWKSKWMGQRMRGGCLVECPYPCGCDAPKRCNGDEATCLFPTGARNEPILRPCEMIPNVQKRYDYCWRSLRFARQRKEASVLFLHLDNARVNLDCDQRRKLWSLHTNVSAPHLLLRRGRKSIIFKHRLTKSSISIFGWHTLLQKGPIASVKQPRVDPDLVCRPDQHSHSSARLVRIITLRKIHPRRSNFRGLNDQRTFQAFSTSKAI